MVTSSRESRAAPVGRPSSNAVQRLRVRLERRGEYCYTPRRARVAPLLLLLPEGTQRVKHPVLVERSAEEATLDIHIDAGSAVCLHPEKTGPDTHHNHMPGATKQNRTIWKSKRIRMPSACWKASSPVLLLVLALAACYLSGRMVRNVMLSTELVFSESEFLDERFVQRLRDPERIDRSARAPALGAAHSFSVAGAVLALNFPFHSINAVLPVITRVTPSPPCT